MSSSSPFPALDGAEFMVLTTHRRSGAPVHTTVWFAEHGGKLYVTTMETSGKVKRVSNSGSVVVAPSDARGTVSGPEQKAQARVLTENEYPVAFEALEGKYRDPFRQGVSRPMPAPRTYLEISPATE
jgi:PPOX class probable F420-dependent enzyme